MPLSTDIVVRKAKTLVISDAQLKMLQMAADDVPRTEIAKKLKLSVRTIEAHFDKIRTAFGCKSTTGLITTLMRKNVLK